MTSEAEWTLREMQDLPDASPQDLTQQQISQLREFLIGSLYHFAWYVFGFHDFVPEIHGKLSALIGLWGTPGYERIMIQIPREFFKTSMCTIANPCWQVVRDPDAPIAIFNEVEAKASQWVRTIRDVVSSNVLFQTLWPELLPPGVAIGSPRSMPRWWKWNDYEIVFQRNKIQPEASITALGIGSSAAGRHWPKIIKDDLISEAAVRSPSVMEFTKEWFDRSLFLERPALKGWDLIPCTSWAYNDLYAYVLRKYDYKLYRRSALENEFGEPDAAGESIFPSKLTTVELRKHHERDPYGFSSQMQNLPMPGRDRRFDPAWIRWGEVDWRDIEHPKFRIRSEDYDPQLRGEARLVDPAPQVISLYQMYKAILWDPAPTEEAEIARDKGARNALVVEGLDPWGRRFILDVWAERSDPMDVMNKVFALASTWGAYTVGIEEVNFSKIYRHWLVQMQIQRGIALHVMRLKPGKRDKHTRITALVPGHRSGLYYYNSNGCAELVKEMVEYPYGSTLDCLDALAYDYRLGRPESPEESQLQLARQRQVRIGQSQVTGY